jgi:hypothetical protein
MGYILATGYPYKNSCRAFLRLPGYWQPFIIVFGLLFTKNAHRLDEDAAYAQTRAARENERKRRLFVRTSPFVQSQRGPKNTKSRLATSRAPPAALVRCPAPLTGRGRSPLSPRPPLVNPTRRRFSSPRHAAPLTARSCPRRGRWGPPWAPPPPASPAGSQ